MWESTDTDNMGGEDNRAHIDKACMKVHQGSKVWWMQLDGVKDGDILERSRPRGPRQEMREKTGRCKQRPSDPPTCHARFVKIHNLHNKTSTQVGLTHVYIAYGHSSPNTA